MRLLEPGHLDEDYPIKTVFENKRFSSIFCKRTNNIHELEGCFLRGQLISNGFKVSNDCIVESGILLVRLQKILENVLFSKKENKNKNVVIGYSSSKCPWFEWSHCNNKCVQYEQSPIFISFIRERGTTWFMSTSREILKDVLNKEMNRRFAKWRLLANATSRILQAFAFLCNEGFKPHSD